MKKIAKNNTKFSAEDIAEMADQGKDITKYFTNKGTMKKPIQRVNVDFTDEMLVELDKMASRLNISRQAVIKTYLRESLDRHYLANKAV